MIVWTDPNYKGINFYIRAKTLAEKAAWDYMKNIDSNMTLTTINPGLILGPILNPKDILFLVRVLSKCSQENYLCIQD